MRRFIAGVVFGLVAGAALVIAPPLLSDDIARVVSQRIYDCGIQIAVSNGTISGFDLSGHRHYFCIKSGVSGLSFDDVGLADKGARWSWKVAPGVVTRN